MATKGERRSSAEAAHHSNTTTRLDERVCGTIESYGFVFVDCYNMSVRGCSLVIGFGELSREKSLKTQKRTHTPHTQAREYKYARVRGPGRGIPRSRISVVPRSTVVLLSTSHLTGSLLAARTKLELVGRLAVPGVEEGAARPELRR